MTLARLPLTADHPDLTSHEVRVPSDSQRAAIEAPAEPLLVLAGPGAGKTFCLIERIRYLLEQLELQPERICAFTFTNKAAGEIAERLERTLGARAARVKTGTIHAFCAQLLREFGTRIGLEPGFGIADDDYQRAVLRRLGYPPRYCASLLNRFAAHRFRQEAFAHGNDAEMFEKYERFLDARRVIDFDSLVIRTAELLSDHHVLERVRARWDCVLVDEFQDLNHFQYEVVREIGREHGHVFAVGDEEQSIYAWAGADTKVFVRFMNDFALRQPITLRENRRCPREVLALARRLVEANEPLFEDRKQLEAHRSAPGCVSARTFRDEDAEVAWIIEDLRREREHSGIAWGDVALLYRKHEIGDVAESALLAAGLPCRLAHGRALAEDAVVAYAIAALRVIAFDDDVHEDAFLGVVLPSALLDTARAEAERNGIALREQLGRMADGMPREHGERKKIRRAFYTLDNLEALGHRHETLAGLVEELLAQRVGTYRTLLEEHHDALTDPRDHAEVVRLAGRLTAALESQRSVWLPRMRGLEIALKGMLVTIGIGRVALGGEPPDDAECVTPEDASALGLPLTVFKALQLMRMGSFANVFRDFTAIDVETTDKKLDGAELVEIAAVRVRDGAIVDELHSLVRPRGAIAVGATAIHGLTHADVADAPAFEEIWPRVRAFCGADVLVAHNGYEFDFPILRRLSGEALCTYDTLPLARQVVAGSAKLEHLARRFGIDPGASHRALDDTRTLARVCLALHETKISYARKTALVNLLDYLGLALAIAPEEQTEEVGLLRRLTRSWALGRYSDCLEFYAAERARAEDNSLPTVEDLVEWLGGRKAMDRVRAVKTAAERYPAAMARLRRLLAQCTDGMLRAQIEQFLERVALSRSDGIDPDRERVNLLTLHSTKGLEFSRVYILGVEDAQLPGATMSKTPSRLEVEEARRLLYVGMTRAKDRLVLTRVEARLGHPTGGHRFLDEMGLVPEKRT